MIHYLQQLHETRHPETLMSYQEYPYSELYEREIMLGHLVYIFTGIALLIGGMGVLAFSVFIAESKTKEIALRKVNGASEGQIMIYLNRIFTGQVVVACHRGDSLFLSDLPTMVARFRVQSHDKPLDYRLRDRGFFATGGSRHRLANTPSHTPKPD